MRGLFELLICLFSGSEMMLTAVTKILIVDTLRNHQPPTPFSFPDHNPDIFNIESRSPDSVSADQYTPTQRVTATPTSAVPSTKDQHLSPTLPLAVTSPKVWKPSTRKSLNKALTSSSLQNDDLLLAENKMSPFTTKNRTSISKKIPEQAYPLTSDSEISTTVPKWSDFGQPTTTIFWARTEEGEERLSNSSGTTRPFKGSTVDSQNDGSDGEGGVEKRVSWYLMLDQVCVYIPWTVIGPLSGAWSDRHGRKPLLLVPGMCHLLAVLVYLLVASWPEHLLPLLLLGGLLRGACGKHAMFITALYCVVSDAAPREKTSARFATLLGCRYAGICSGTIGAGILLEYFSISRPLLVVSGLQAFCLFLVLTALQEPPRSPPSPSPGNRNTGVISSMKSFITTLRYPENSEERVKLAVEKEEEEEEEESDSLSSGVEIESQRSVSPLRQVMLILSLSFLTQWLWSSQREISVQMVSRQPFVWPKSWYGYLFGLIFGVAGTAAMTLVPLVVRLGPRGSDSDVHVLFIALLCTVLGSLWSALAVWCHSDWQMFASNSLVAVALSSNSTCRAMLNKAVSPCRHTTALAVLSVLENLSKLLGPLLHTAIFVATFSFSPFFVFLLMAVEALLMLNMLRGLGTRS